MISATNLSIAASSKAKSELSLRARTWWALGPAIVVPSLGTLVFFVVLAGTDAGKALMAATKIFGISWPISVAPYEVTVMAVNAGHEESVELAEKLVEGLQQAGVDVLYDDRDERPGVKFKDVDLVGTPLRVSFGERSLAKGEVEIKERASGEMTGAPVESALEEVLARVNRLRKELDPDAGA